MKRQFTETEVQSAIQKSAAHCARLLTNNQDKLCVSGQWSAESVIDDLKNGGSTRMNARNRSFEFHGLASSVSRRLEALKDAINGNPRHQWLIYWTQGK